MNIHLPSPLWRIFCYPIEKKIERARPAFRNFLSADNDPSSEVIVAERLAMDQKYELLRHYFNNDPKRRFMIDNNHLKFLQAVLYLYRTSNIAGRAGILMVPAETYAVINAAQQSFNDLIERLQLRGPHR